MAAFRTYLFRLMLGLAFLALAVLWLISFGLGKSLTPPGWVAVCIVLLPYLYALLLGCSLLLWGLKRKKMLLLLPALTALSMIVLWGQSFLPKQNTAVPDQREELRILVWNVQRMGQWAEGASAVPQKIACVAQLIQREEPDILALLEVTYEQLLGLQKELGSSPDHCLWTDYYGTGRQKSGGLATCISNGKSSLSISRKRELNLPPAWKYLFIEIQQREGNQSLPFNFLAVHIAPPKVSSETVGTIVRDILSGNTRGLSRGWKLLEHYEKQVTLQGAQAVDALRYIEERFQDPTLIAGDFNSSQDAALHLRLRERMTDTWAAAGWGFGATRFWGDFLPLRIDYIYADKDFSVLNSQTFPAECSDHRPVLSSVYLAP